MIWIKIAIAAVSALALLIFLGFPSNFLVDTVRSRIEAGTGYRLRFGGETTVRFWPAPAISFRALAFGRDRIAELSLRRPALRLPL